MHAPSAVVGKGAGSQGAQLVSFLTGDALTSHKSSVSRNAALNRKGECIRKVPLQGWLDVPLRGNGPLHGLT